MEIQEAIEVEDNMAETGYNETNEVAVLKAEVVNANERLAEVITIVSGISGEITEIIWKIGG